MALRNLWRMQDEKGPSLPFNMSWESGVELRFRMAKGPDGQNYVTPLEDGTNPNWAGHPTKGGWKRLTSEFGRGLEKYIARHVSEDHGHGL